MAIIKCKMCGGDLNVEENSQIAVCEYCGTQQTVPKQDNEKKLTLFARANRLRFACEFDKAAGVYESIVAEFPEEAEAYWGLVLCKYGIEYVDDPATGKKVPTCHRSSFDSVLEDANFELVLEYADVVTRKIYREEAKAIEELRRGIIEVSSREEPYDIFICYKETDENGQRTLDSVLAQDLYDALTEKGYRVFFSRITLEDKLGQEYEPYIFAALNSARVMLAVGTDYEYYNAPWVKNEWSRYLQLIAAGQKKSLIPCYKNIDVYDMPKEFAKLQAQDLGKVGATQDLLRGIEKLLGKTSESAILQQPAPIPGAAAPNVDSLLRRGNLFLEDSDWTNAKNYFDKVLDIVPECGAAYLGKFLAEKKAKTVSSFAKRYAEDIAAHAPERTRQDACKADETFIDACLNKYQVPEFLDAREIRSLLRFDLTYPAGLADYYHDCFLRTAQMLGSEKDFVRAEKYADADVQTQCELLRSKILNDLHAQQQSAEQEEASEKQRVTEAYHTFLKETESTLAARQKEALEKKKAHEELAERLRLERKKHEKAAAIEREKQEKLRKIAEQEAKKKVAKAKKLTIICAAAAAAVIAVVLIVTQVIIPSSNYSKAEEMLAAGEYDGAIEAFTALGDYKDARERVMQIEEQQENERLAKEAAEKEARNAQAYADAEALLANEDYDGAAEAFEALGGYQDAAERAQDCPYIEAEQLLAQGKTAEASIAFGRIAGYKDALERSFALRASNDPTIIAESDHIVALKEDGTAVAIGNNEYGQCDVADWTNLVAIDAGFLYTVGLKADGTVLAAGYNDDGRCNVSDWTDITAIRAGSYHTVGLKTNGTVVAVGDNDLGQCDVADWTDITAISAREHHTVGLKADGTVVAVGYNDDGRCNVSDWTDITAIRAGSYHTVGLKADGTVVAAGNNKDGQCDVSDWTDIVAIKATYKHTVGLKADGTVVAVGFNEYGQCDVSDWTDIIAIDAATFHTVGLKADGTVVAIGNNGDGQCNVSDWKDIVAVNAGGWDTVGLKADGTVVVVGGNVDDKCNASGWTDIKLPN